MTLKRRRRGRIGEAVAAAFLENNGYKILEKNYRCSLGEIDIIARCNDILIFIEVRTRSTPVFGFPQESVDWRKQSQLRRLAAYYLKQKGWMDQPCRFDVVTVMLNDNERVSNIEIIPEAFI